MNKKTQSILAAVLVVIMIPIYRVPLTWRVIYVIPIFVILLLFTYAISCLALNFGVFMDDLANIISVLLRLIFYMSGIFYNVEKRVPEPYNHWMMNGNPMTFLITSMRNCVLYEKSPNLKVMAIWFVVSIVLAVIGTKVIIKHENSYVKLI